MSHEAAPGREPACEDRATRWLSHGFETLVASLEGDAERSAASIDYDVVIVGSGYGGSVAAAELAKTRGDRRICVLERGCEHLPGSFPSRMADLAGHVRFSTKHSHAARGEREGLFDVRVGDDLCALVANGVGGGSLINAGVMALPRPDVFASPRWPKPFQEDGAVAALFQLAAGLQQRLGATQTVKSVRQPEPRKYTALGRIAGAAPVEPLSITVALADAGNKTLHTAAGIAVDACVGCGDCATGCNHNAKLSLDVTLLAEARQHGAEVFAGATVLKIEKLTAGGVASPIWQLHVVHTDQPLRRRQGSATLIRARRVVLAAGTFGSTEILLRSQGRDLGLSRKLGQQVSSNGDLIAVASGGVVQANCVGDEDRDPRLVGAPERVGPTITGMIDLRDARADAMIVQDLAVPGALRSLLDESVATATAFHRLAESDTTTHGPATRDPCAVDRRETGNTLVVAIIGHDTADGVMKLNGGDAPESGDGAATVQWPALRDYPPLLARHRRFEQLVRASGLGARALPNPMWRLLPEQLGDMFGGETGPLVTVHPLGGCPMGDDAGSGVVDDCGRVFDASPEASGRLHEGLVVLDGSIIPASLGMNPALTIASVALRAVDALRADWGYLVEGTGTPIGDRPCFKQTATVEPSRATQIEVLERLSGPVALQGLPRPDDQDAGVAAAGSGSNPHVELTMRFDPIAIRDLTSGTDAATLTLQPGHGRLRIFAQRPPDDTEAPDEEALLIANIKGTLRAFSHEPSVPLVRRLRGLWAWFRNRGLRDSVQWVIDRFSGASPPVADDKSMLREAIERSKSAWALASRAGAVRLLTYDLQIDRVLASKLPADFARSFRAAAIKGEKRVTYSRRANPWRQLMEVSLTAFPRAQQAGAVLALDTGYLARQEIPLFRVVQQQDQARALVDVAALGLYLLRILIHVHLWSFRLPDAPRLREIRRLPGDVPGLPPPQIHEFVVDEPRHGIPVAVRLTHYPYGEAMRARAIESVPDAREAIRTPILLIHGYSASGTTFAHHAVRPNVASSLWKRGRDVWIADLRTSAGMPHAKAPWTFEEVGLADIPMAVHQVCALTGAAQIDVFAHCMGSAMLGMALLGSETSHERFAPLRRELPDRIRHLVMSQVAPAVIFTPANVFRAYAMQYLRHYLPLHDYQFRPLHRSRRTDQALDRLLATIPYPQEEFDRENPFWTPWRRTPWVATRHRMDALYGRDFNVNNVPAKVLDSIDDHFGPLSIETVSQAIHFAHFRTITNRRGYNDYVRPDRLRDQLRFPMLHVHGRDNGLVSRQTPGHFQKVLIDCDGRFESRDAFLPRLYEAGHQDLLIGRPAGAMFKEVHAFLEQPRSATAQQPSEPRITFTAQIPSYGVRVPPPIPAGSERCSLGDDDASGTPIAALLIPVAEDAGRYRPVDQSGGVAEPSADWLARAVKWRALVPVSPARQTTRFTFELAGYMPPAVACGILVLLLYNQSAGIGAPAPGASGPFEHLAQRIATKSQGGSGLAGLARAVAAAHVDLGGRIGDGFVGKLVGEMALAVQRVFECVADSEIGLGILRPPPRRKPSDAPASTFSFALASCQYPGGLLDRTPPATPREAPTGPSDASYLRLLAVLEGRRAASAKPPLPVPQFLILAGDQIYADATAGLFDARMLDDRLRFSYEAFLGAPGPRSVLSRLPALMRPDDHEIDDNWEPDPPDARPGTQRSNQRLKDAGVREYLRQQCDKEPPASGLIKLWQPASIGGLEFFLADARTERTPRTAATVAGASLLGEQQSRALDRWLADKTLPGPRFLVSAAMVLPRHLEQRGADLATAIRSDSWDGYPASLHRLLARVYERGGDDVVFLSGDEHISNVATIQISKVGAPGEVVAHSVHSSALYAPYPFANAVEEDFARTEAFEFSYAGATYRCAVATRYPTRGDGFAVLSVSAAEAGWQVCVRFDRERQDPCDPANTIEFQIEAALVQRTAQQPGRLTNSQTPAEAGA